MIPGFVYNYPPAQNKISPFHLEAQELITKIHWNEGKIVKQLIGSFLYTNQFQSLTASFLLSFGALFMWIEIDPVSTS